MDCNKLCAAGGEHGGFLGMNWKKPKSPSPKIPIVYKSHQVPVKFSLKILIVINVLENVKLFTYKVYHMIFSIPYFV